MDLINSYNSTSPVSKRWREIFIRDGVTQKKRKDEIVVENGCTTSAFYYLADGIACAYNYKTNGEMMIHFFIPTHAVIGEGALLGWPETGSSNIKAITDCEFKVLEYDAAVAKIREDPRLKDDLINCLISKYYAGLFFRCSSAYSIYDRILQLLYFEVEQTNKKCIIITQEELATLISAHQISVTKELKNMEDNGLILRGRGKIHILDVNRIRQYGEAMFDKYFS